MGRPTHYRHWSAAEDAALVRRAGVGWPSLRALAVGSGRTYVSIRTRASRLRAIRVEPVQRAARGPTPCRYCGGAFLSRGSVRYCGDECRTLARGQCPGCGRPMTDLACARCGRDGKRAVWPGQARIAGRAPAP